MKVWKILRIYKLSAETKIAALESWSKAVAAGTTEEMLVTIIVKEDEPQGFVQTLKKQVLG